MGSGGGDDWMGEDNSCRLLHCQRRNRELSDIASGLRSPKKTGDSWVESPLNWCRKKEPKKVITLGPLGKGYMGMDQYLLPFLGGYSHP